jgi:OOP family OmpA-OmpF porin
MRSPVNLARLKFVSGTVVGHTDSSGAEAYNQKLSERRAQAVADYLQAKGIATGRLTASGAGESQPIADNKTADGRALNRRVVLKRTDCDQP